MSYKKIHPRTVVMKGEVSYKDQNHFLYQTVNMFISAVKLVILTWGSMEIDLLFEPQVAIQETFGTFPLASFFSPRGCRLVALLSPQSVGSLSI